MVKGNNILNGVNVVTREQVEDAVLLFVDDDVVVVGTEEDIVEVLEAVA